MALTDGNTASRVTRSAEPAPAFNTFPLDQLPEFRPELISAFRTTRQATEELAAAVPGDRQGIQSMTDASPVKWHRAHTSWFFETFILQSHEPGFDWFNNRYCYLFNSYYNGIGAQYPRAERGAMTEPDPAGVAQYRQAVDERMVELLETVDDTVFATLAPLLLLGLNHEQQHQELLLTDYQHAWCLDPAGAPPWPGEMRSHIPVDQAWLEIPGGPVRTGHDGPGFCYDNETPPHKYWLEAFELSNRPVSNVEFAAFIEDGGYQDPLLWLADGWAWVREHDIRQPLYWRQQGQTWLQNSARGIRTLEAHAPLVNISFYEANAFASWAGARLPTEHEWEHAMRSLGCSAALGQTGGEWPVFPAMMPQQGGNIWLGRTWEWTASPYVPYPRFKPGAGAVGEYNGKFMSNQVVLRGCSGFTPPGHARVSYRNFFYPQARWQQSGIRLARDGTAQV